MRVLRPAAVSLLLLATAACGGGSDGATPPTTTPPSTSADPSSTTAPTSAPTSAASAAALPAVRLAKLTDVAEGTAIALRAGDPAIYVTEQTGLVRALRGGALDPTPVLDLRPEVLAAGERGLLGLAFSADGGTLYAYWTAKQPVGQVTIASFRMAGTRADKASLTRLITIDHSEYANHNGGILQLGPDGFLYIGVGDGGYAGDPHDNAQNTGVLLGKVLRIDPRNPSGGRPYGIPPGNPFADGSKGRPEVWAYGLRNPWRLSFDPPSGTLWIADVGQDKYEEVDRADAATPGVNYGWSQREALHPYERGERPAGAVDPVSELTHAGGFCSVTGGFVYRGTAIPGLVGRYVFGDYCNPALQVLTDTGGGTWARAPLGIDVTGVRTFGTDATGELLVLSTDGLSRLAPA
jgi:glucose/arabinose dehydrogenase